MWLYVEGITSYHIGQYTPELIEAIIAVIEAETSLIPPILNVDVADFTSTSVIVTYTIGYSSSVRDYLETEEFETRYMEYLESFQGLSEMLFRTTFSDILYVQMHFIFKLRSFNVSTVSPR